MTLRMDVEIDKFLEESAKKFGAHFARLFFVTTTRITEDGEWWPVVLSPFYPTMPGALMAMEALQAEHEEPLSILTTAHLLNPSNEKQLAFWEAYQADVKSESKQWQ